MHRQSQHVLFGYLLFLLLCGLAGYALSGIDAHQHMHGVRLALVIGICGMLAGRFRRNGALAVLAIDFGALLILAAGLNYVRLCFKWYGIQGPDWYTPYLAAAMALGSFVALPLLVRSRPKPNRSAVEWWRPSPLISLVVLVLIRFPRCRHGLGAARRAGLTLGTLLVIIGFVFTNSDRLPRRSVAAMFQTARLAQEHQALLRDLLDDPQQLRQILNDREQLEELLADPRAQDLITDLTADGGLLEGADVRALAERVAEGDLDAVNELLDEAGLPAAKELLADMSSNDGALKELLDDNELDAAKTLLSSASSDEARSAAKTLLSRAADLDSTKRQDVASALGKIGHTRSADLLSHLPDITDIDLNDTKFQAAMRELGLDPQEAARLAAGAADATTRTTDRLVQRLASSVGATNHLGLKVNPRMNTRVLPQRILAEHAPIERLTTRLLPEKVNSQRSGHRHRLGLRSIQIRKAPTPNEPLNVFALVKPRPDFLQERLGEYFASATTEPLHNQGESPEPAPQETSPQPPVIPVAVAAVTVTQLDPTPLQPPSAELDDRPALIDDHPTRHVAQAPTTIQTQVSGNDDRMLEAGAASTRFGRLAPMLGAACMLAGLLTIGASLSRR
ncbi:MAG: hypothetical protein O7D91_08670 [Planctomycetota bacterium]|nr:hypothetical protein [Planctomycetota bacterium]